MTVRRVPVAAILDTNLVFEISERVFRCHKSCASQLRWKRFDTAHSSGATDCEIAC